MSRMSLYYLAEGVFALRTFGGEKDPQQLPFNQVLHSLVIAGHLGC
jgi:hypothetical protein